jgi:hypothetical protein
VDRLAHQVVGAAAGSVGLAHVVHVAPVHGHGVERAVVYHLEQLEGRERVEVREEVVRVDEVVGDGLRRRLFAYLSHELREARVVARAHAPPEAAAPGVSQYVEAARACRDRVPRG